MAPEVTVTPRPPRPLLGRLDPSTIRALGPVLAGGGIAVLPTDTLYGLHCAASRRDALSRIAAIKGRRSTGGFIVLAADMAMVERLVRTWPGSSRNRLAAIWPAPLTAVLPARPTLPRIVAPAGRVAVRIPALGELRRLIATVGEPLVSTSANLSGAAPITRIGLIRRIFPGLEAYLSARGRLPSSPSTIVDFTGPRPRLVRAGRYHWEAGR
jgi:L-threonylcarbamoyladenylate synthase